jgi:hypothetical protein
LTTGELVLTIGVGRSAEAGVATGSLVPGLLVLAGWAGAVVVALRLRHRALIDLHLVLAVSMLVAVVSMSRIFHGVQYWLVLYAWSINALTMLATCWTLGALIAKHRSRMHRPRVALVGAAAAAAIVTLSSVLFAIESTSVEPPVANTSRVLGELLPRTIAALEAREAAGRGRNGRYLVTWNDPTALDLTGWGLFNELDRRGFDVGVPEIHRGAATDHRVLGAAGATGRVHLQGGSGIAVWRSKPGVIEVAYFDPRNREERLKSDRLRLELISGLSEAGLPQLIRSVDGEDDDDDLVANALNPRVPSRLRYVLARMMRLGLPTAVFLVP